MDNQVEQLLSRKHRACYLKFIALTYQIEIKTIAEIGVFQGKNAKVLREQFPKAHLYLIDPWELTEEYLISGNAVSKDPKVYEEAFRQVKMYFSNDRQATLIKKNSLEAILEVPDKLDLVFIDANHTYDSVKKDILAWKLKVRSGGILSGHNYGRRRLPGVKQAVDETFKNSTLLGQDEVWLYFC